MPRFVFSRGPPPLRMWAEGVIGCEGLSGRRSPGSSTAASIGTGEGIKAWQAMSTINTVSAN